jgi:hypothetical protein
MVLATCLLALLVGLPVEAQRGGGAGPGQRGAGPGGRGGPAGRGNPFNVAEDAGPKGVRVTTDRALAGYTLFAPLNSDTTMLIDMDGQVVRTWKSEFVPGAWVDIRDNGNVVRAGRQPMPVGGFGGGGQGGRIQEWTFDGELVWDFVYDTEDRLLHHDGKLLPNGNLLLVAWEKKSPEQSRQAGRREGFVPAGGLWPEVVIELEPQPPGGGRVVWEWHAWDHLVQDVDRGLPNYGDPAARPERIDLNGDDAAQAASPPPNLSSDLFHVNSVAYNAERDEIILSVPNFNEVWVIDHSTTTAEAAGSSGGRSGNGGDLLYRWGNPRAYGRGTPEDRRLGFEHDAQWIPPGSPGAGHIMVFSNRGPRGDGTENTRVYEIAPPIDARGRYVLPSAGPFGPAAPVWTYDAPDFTAPFISGAVRLPNGNTLVTSGPQGRLFEVNDYDEIVWEYWSPFTGNEPTGGGAPNPFAIFKAIRLPLDHPAVAGRTLQPLTPQPPAESPVGEPGAGGRGGRGGRGGGRGPA